MVFSCIDDFLVDRFLFMQKEIYKVRRKSDGLFSQGGFSPSFTKEGKFWTTKQHLKLYLRCFHLNEDQLANPDLYKETIAEIQRQFDDLEVVEIKVTVSKSIPAREFFPQKSQDE